MERPANEKALKIKKYLTSSRKAHKKRQYDFFDGLALVKWTELKHTSLKNYFPQAEGALLLIY